MRSPCPADVSGLLKAYIALISGRVQGVGFRWFTVQEASKRAVLGYVRNLSDGRVEVLVQGQASDVEGMLARLREGPVASRVDELDLRTVPLDQELHSFEVQY